MSTLAGLLSQPAHFGPMRNGNGFSHLQRYHREPISLCRFMVQNQVHGGIARLWSQRFNADLP